MQQLFILLVIYTLFSSITAIFDFFNKQKAFQSRPIEDNETAVFPKLLPHKDNCYLVEFHHDDCDHCQQMEPVLQRLEEDLDTKIRRINIFRRKEFQALLQSVGHDECNSFPFYYNRRTGQAVCGATSYMNLRMYIIFYPKVTKL
jgi:thiol-disulfide isomerase/thioredoxin